MCLPQELIDKIFSYQNLFYEARSHTKRSRAERRCSQVHSTDVLALLYRSAPSELDSLGRGTNAMLKGGKAQDFRLYALRT